MEKNLRASGIINKRRSRGPSSRHRSLQRSSVRSRKISKHAMRVINTSKSLVQSFQLSKDQSKFALPQFSTVGTQLDLSPEDDEESDCSNIELNGPLTCNSLQRSAYRSQDGTCNNLKHPMWGRANIALTQGHLSITQFCDHSRAGKFLLIENKKPVFGSYLRGRSGA